MNGYAFLAGWVAFSLVNHLFMMPEFKWSLFVPNIMVGVVIALIMIVIQRKKRKKINKAKVDYYATRRHYRENH